MAEPLAWACVLAGTAAVGVLAGVAWATSSVMPAVRWAIAALVWALGALFS